MIRTVKPEDASRLLEIYSPHVLETVVSFETELPSLESFKERIKEYSNKFPWLVYEIEGRVVGYVYASTHRSRKAYDWSTECTVYIDKQFHGQKIATKLYKKLFELLKAQGVVNVFGGITLPNEGSVKLHESMGFIKVAQFKDVGFKHGHWWDVGWWQLQLQRPATPKEIGIPKII